MGEQFPRTPVDCNSCSGKHWTAREVWACGQFGPVTHWRPPAPVSNMVTPRQLDYITSLGGDAVHAAKLTKREASAYIDRLKQSSKAATVSAGIHPSTQTWANEPAPWPLMTPRAMVEQIRNGRYAVQPDANTPLTFVRVSRPTTGKKKGAIVLQTQHSDWYKDCVIIWPSGRVTVLDKRIDSSLLLVVTDPTTAAMRYGVELGCCSSCGRELTDERSRWYGIGPECEKRWPEVINRVDDSDRGPYRS